MSVVAAAEMRCTNCDSPNVEVFCAACGEKQPDHHDVTVKHFFGELLHEVANLDSKLLHTLRVLVTRPGQLTVDYFAGRKTRSISPLRLVLALFALQLILYTFYKPVAVYSLENMIALTPQKEALAPFEMLAKKKDMTLTQFARRVDERWPKNVSMLQLLSLFGTALVLELLYLGRHHLGEHLVFAAHYLSFSYLFTLAVWPVYLVTGLKMSAAVAVVLVINNLVLAAYFGLALHRYYAESLSTSIAKGVLAYIGMFAVSMFVTYFALGVSVAQVMKAT